jgi:hypothetical protein
MRSPAKAPADPRPDPPAGHGGPAGHCGTAASRTVTEARGCYKTSLHQLDMLQTAAPTTPSIFKMQMLLQSVFSYESIISLNHLRRDQGSPGPRFFCRVFQFNGFKMVMALVGDHQIKLFISHLSEPYLHTGNDLRNSLLCY